MRSEAEKAIKEIRDYKARDDGNVLGDALKLLGEDGVKLQTQLISNIHKNGEWAHDFLDITMTSLKKKPKTTQCNDHCAISLITHTHKTVASILIRIERKTVDALGEDQFGFTRGKGGKEKGTDIYRCKRKTDQKTVYASEC